MDLAQLKLESGRRREAAAQAARVLELEPGNPRALFFRGLADYYLDQTEPAERSLLGPKQSGLAGEYPAGLLHLGMILASSPFDKRY